MPPRFIIFYVLPLPHSPLHTPPAACSAHPRPMPRAPSTSHRTHLTPCHALFRPSSRTLSPLVTQSPTPRHALSHPSSRTLPSLVTQSPTPRHALSLSLSKHIQLYHYDAATTTKPHHRIHTLLRNGPFHRAKRPISQHDSAHFRTRNDPFCNTLSISTIHQRAAITKIRTSNFIKKNLRIHPNIITFAVANLSQAVKSDL